jgi:hypothetical protein
MTTARQIIDGALRFGLNRLSPGETLDADTANACLVGLNDVADQFNGGRFLFREILTAATVTGNGTLGTTWPTLSPGTHVLGAFYAPNDQPIDPITLTQYSVIPDKAATGLPQVLCWDGYAAVYFYPQPVALSITLRTMQHVVDFADLDTDYGMPKGYKSSLSDLLAERMAPSLVGDVSARVVRNAANARARLDAQTANPAIINGGHRRPNILSGW